MSLMEYFSCATLSDIGSWCSIIGLVMTIFTFMLVFSIKKKFLFKSRVEEHQQSLREIASQISGLLQSYSKNMDDIDDAIAIADVKLRNIKNGANGDLLSDVKTARSKIKAYRVSGWIKKAGNKNEKSAREINTAINVVVEEMNNVKKQLLIGA